MHIDFNTNKYEVFNSLLFDLQEAKTRFVINYGGAGSGKSYSQTQHEIIKCLHSQEKVLVIRKIGATLKNSVIDLFNSILTQWGLSDIYTENKSLQFIQFVNGSQILFKGMDDPEKIKSIAGITRIWCEEASELTFEDMKQLNLRLRGRTNLQMTLTFNPISEEHWIKSHFFDTRSIREKTTILRTTYKDNKFIDDEYKKEIESYKDFDENYYKIYALGEWGLQTKGRIFPDWEECVEMPDVDRTWYGLDFGFSNDPTAIVQVCKHQDRLYFDEICYRTELTTSDIANLLKKSGYHGQTVICDSASPMAIEELRRMGIAAVKCYKPKGSINSGIDFLRKSKIVITQRSSNIKKENRYYQWDTDRKGEQLAEPKDFCNHLMDAMRYAVSLNHARQTEGSGYAIFK